MVGHVFKADEIQPVMPTATTFDSLDASLYVEKWEQKQKQQTDLKAMRDIQSRIKDREGWKRGRKWK